jgi:hypothetical protein
MLNPDMVGRLRESCDGFGTRSAQQLSAIVLQGAHSASRLPNRTAWDAATTCLLQQENPGAAFFTGSHSDYHRPSDTWDKLNIEASQSRRFGFGHGPTHRTTVPLSL